METIPSLIPTLPDAVNKRIRHNVAQMQPGDQLHLTAPVLGWPKGQTLPVHGYCTVYDQGQPYRVVAYVRGGTHCVEYGQRDARRFPSASQQERWFGSVLMYLTEIDLTDYADCLRLERQPAPLATLLAPEIVLPLSYRQAA